MYIYLLFFLFLITCGESGQNDPTKSFFQIKIQGIDERPEGATGEFEPYSETFTILTIARTAADGTIETLSDTEQEIRVSNRPQIIYSKKIPESEYTKAFNEIAVIVKEEVIASSKLSKAQLVKLSSTTITSKSFIIPRADDMNFYLKVNWRGTVARDTENKVDIISEPGLVLEEE